MKIKARRRRARGYPFELGALPPARPQQPSRLGPSAWPGRRVTLAYARRHLHELIQQARTGWPVFIKSRKGSHLHGAVLIRFAEDEEGQVVGRQQGKASHYAVSFGAVTLEELRAKHLGMRNEADVSHPGTQEENDDHL